MLGREESHHNPMAPRTLSSHRLPKPRGQQRNMHVCLSQAFSASLRDPIKDAESS